MKITQSAVQSEGSSQSWQSASVSTTAAMSVTASPQEAAQGSTAAVISAAAFAILREELDSSALTSQSTTVLADGSTQASTLASLISSASSSLTSATLVSSGAGDALSSRQTWSTDTRQSGLSNDISNPRLLLLIAILEALTKRRVELFDGTRMLQQPENAAPTSQVASQAMAATPAWSIRIASSQVHEEAQTTSYHGSGQVTTADGRQISFSLDLGMQRYERQESTVSLAIGNAAQMKDPLVLNLSTDRVRLQAETFSFDLNSDGIRENIATLGEGSAFLALDRNGNGQIDNGSELFGTSSGDGFADLAQFDGDHNGWIDENDAVFNQLTVWRPDGEAQTLQEAGVGAISLNHATTDFTLKADGATEGMIRSTGMFLMEDGEARTVQQVDLVA